MADIISTPIYFLSSEYAIPDSNSADEASIHVRDARTSAAYHELGGNVSEIKERPRVTPYGQYQEFIDIYREDPRKREIALGLGGYGLIMMTEQHLPKMKKSDQLLYGAGLISLGALLHGRSRVLKTDGSEGSPAVTSRYGSEVDGQWTRDYGDQLWTMRKELVDSALYLAATDTLRQAPVSEQSKLLKQTYRPESIHLQIVTADSELKVGDLIVARTPSQMHGANEIDTAA